MARSDLPSTARAVRDRLYGLQPELKKLQMQFIGGVAGIALLLAASITAGLFVFYPHRDAVFPVAVLVPLLLSFAVFRVADRLYRRRVRTMVVEALAASAGLTFQVDGIAVDDMASHKISPSADGIAVRDAFTGTYNNAPFSIQEITLQREGRPLRCLLARIRFPKSFDGHSVAATKNALQAYFPRRFADYGKVGVASSKYDRAIEIFATERSEGRLVMDSGFLERLMESGVALKSKWVAVSFLKNEAFMLFDHPRAILDIHPLWAPVRGEFLHGVYGQFEAFFKIIDALRANRHLSLE